MGISESPRTLVIGNGFDLEHGRRTEYIAFLKDCLHTVFEQPQSKEIEAIFPGYKSASLMKCFNKIYKEYTESGESKKWIDMETELKSLISGLLKFVDELNIEQSSRDVNKRYRRIKSGVYPQYAFLIENFQSVFVKEEDWNKDYEISKKYINYKFPNPPDYRFPADWLTSFLGRPRGRLGLGSA